MQHFGSIRALQTIGLAIILLSLSNFALLSNHDVASETSNGFTKAGNSNQSEILRLPKPIFVVGYPKVGTSSIHAMFACSGIKSSHYCCCGSNRTHTHCNDARSFAQCMRSNHQRKRPILEGCGDYDVYAQMDGELGKKMYLPQHFSLQELHDYAPSATFLLNLRPAEDWVKSVSNWFGLGGRFLKHFHIDHRKTNRTQALIDIFNNHTDFVRDFVSKHPSHRLVEVNIADPNAGKILTREFGLVERCWGKHNQNKRIPT